MDPGTHLVRLESQGTELTKTLTFPAKIGRRIGNKLVPSATNGVYESQVLSRNHAEIIIENGKVFLKDLESSNGTYVEGEKITKPTELQEGANVNFGVVVYDDDGETIKHDKVSVIVRFVEKDLEAVTLPDVIVRSLPPNVNLKSAETQELLFQSLLTMLLEDSQKQNEVELTLQELNEVLDSGELQFKGPEPQISGDTIKLQREARIMKKKVTDLETKVQQLQAAEAANAELKATIETLTAKSEKSGNATEEALKSQQRIAQLEQALEESAKKLEAEEQQRKGAQETLERQTVAISKLEQEVVEAQKRANEAAEEVQKLKDDQRKAEETKQPECDPSLKAEFAELQNNYNALLLECNRAEAKVTLLEYELEVMKDSRQPPLSPMVEKPHLPTSRSLSNLPLAGERKGQQSPRGNVSSKIRNIQAIFEKD